MPPAATKKRTRKAPGPQQRQNGGRTSPGGVRRSPTRSPISPSLGEAGTRLSPPRARSPEPFAGMEDILPAPWQPPDNEAMEGLSEEDAMHLVGIQPGSAAACWLASVLEQVELQRSASNVTVRCSVEPSTASSVDVFHSKKFLEFSKRPPLQIPEEAIAGGSASAATPLFFDPSDLPKPPQRSGRSRERTPPQDAPVAHAGTSSAAGDVTPPMQPHTPKTASASLRRRPHAGASPAGSNRVPDDGDSADTDAEDEEDETADSSDGSSSGSENSADGSSSSGGGELSRRAGASTGGGSSVGAVRPPANSRLAPLHTPRGAGDTDTDEHEITPPARRVVVLSLGPMPMIHSGIGRRGGTGTGSRLPQKGTLPPIS